MQPVLNHPTVVLQSSVPMLFSEDMVLATRDGYKTETRRGIRKTITKYMDVAGNLEAVLERLEWRPACTLNVKETFRFVVDKGNALINYRADNSYRVVHGGESMVRQLYGKGGEPQKEGELLVWPYRPSIFMPRHLSRILLKCTQINVERLQEITRAGCIAEGVRYVGQTPDRKRAVWSATTGNLFTDPIAAFTALWDSCAETPEAKWESNPYVAVIRYELIELASTH